MVLNRNDRFKIERNEKLSGQITWKQKKPKAITHYTCTSFNKRHSSHDSIKPKFHYAHFPMTSPLAQISLCRLPRNFPIQGSFGEVGIMKFGLKGTSRVCHGRHREVGIVEFGLHYAATTALVRNERHSVRSHILTVAHRQSRCQNYTTLHPDTVHRPTWHRFL